MNEHHATEIAFKNGYKKAASEIFEEIERLLYLNYLQGDIFIGKYFDAELENDIAELKKKYLEVHDDRATGD